MNNELNNNDYSIRVTVPHEPGTNNMLDNPGGHLLALAAGQQAKVKMMERSASSTPSL